MITLKYGTTQEQFNELFIESIPVTDRVAGRMLNGMAFSHLKSKWSEHTVIISADELCNTSKHNFLKEFWSSKEQLQLKIENAEFVQVLIESGAAPVENIEGNVHLPEYKIKLIEVDGRI